MAGASSATVTRQEASAARSELTGPSCFRLRLEDLDFPRISVDRSFLVIMPFSSQHLPDADVRNEITSQSHPPRSRVWAPSVLVEDLEGQRVCQRRIHKIRTVNASEIEIYHEPQTCVDEQARGTECCAVLHFVLMSSFRPCCWVADEHSEYGALVLLPGLTVW